MTSSNDDPTRLEKTIGRPRMNWTLDDIKAHNYLRLILTSIYAAPAKPGDRRYAVVDMGERKDI